MVLVGITTTDTEEDIAKLSKKLLSLRVFEDLSEPPQTATKWYGKPWAKSIVDIQGEILSVSQFTLYGTVKRGPSLISTVPQKATMRLKCTTSC